jgi:predicted RNase H-like nuclease (RuvC/YqgF family)
MPPSSGDPRDEPTRPLPPADPRPARVVDEREVAAPVEDPYRTEILLDRLRSLRTALVLVGLIAVAALGVALYTLLTKEEESNTRAGASRQQVSQLSDRVDALESDVKNRATKDDLNQVDDDVKALSKRVDQLAKQAQSASSDSTDKQARSSIDQLDKNAQQLSQSVKDLDQRVRDLENQSQQQQR